MVFRQELLPDAVGVARRVGAARFLPGLIIPPVRQQRLIEGGLVTFQGVGGAEEMAARPDLLDGLEAEGVFIDGRRLHEGGHHLQHFGVQDELLETRRHAAFQPAGAMQDEMRVAETGGPQGHGGLVGGLGVDAIARGDVAGAVGHGVAPGKLAADEHGLGIFRRAEGGRAGLHIHVAGEAAVDHGRAWANTLGHDDHRQGLGVLLRQGPGKGHRRHGARQGEGGRREGLSGLGEGGQPLGHGAIEAQGGVRIDHRESGRASRQPGAVLAQGDRQHVDGVVGPERAQAIAGPYLVGERNERPIHVEMAGIHGQVGGLDRAAAFHVNGVERLRQTGEILHVGKRRGAPPAIQIRRKGRAAGGTEGDVAVFQGQVARRVAGVQRDRRRGQGGLFLDHRRIEAHPFSLDLRSGGGQGLTQGLGQDLHAQLGQHAQGRHMDVLDAIGVDDLEPRIGAGNFGPGTLMNDAGLADDAAAPPVPRRAGAGFNAHSRWLPVSGSPVKLFPYFLPPSGALRHRHRSDYR